MNYKRPLHVSNLVHYQCVYEAKFVCRSRQHVGACLALSDQICYCLCFDFMENFPFMFYCSRISPPSHATFLYTRRGGYRDERIEYIQNNNIV